MSADRDCEECAHCQTINEDQDSYCHLQQRVVYAVCEKFDDMSGRATTQTESEKP